MPKKTNLFTFHVFICNNLEFPSLQSSKFSLHVASGKIRILNTKKVGFTWQVFRFLQIYVFYRCTKQGIIDVPEKRAPTEEKAFTRGYAHKVRIGVCREGS